MRLKTLLGEHRITSALKQGRLRSDLVEFLMAKAHGKPLTLLPAVLFGRFQDPYLVCTKDLSPKDLEGKRVAIRSSSVTTVAWIRGILADDYCVDLERVKWVTFEDAHVAEFRDPPGVERAAAGQTPLAMLLAGEVDAAVLAEPLPKDERLKRVIPDPAAAAADWQRRKGALQINHMVVVRQSLAPEIVREVFQLLHSSKDLLERIPAETVDTSPFGLEANRRNLEVAIDYVHRQKLIPRRYEVDELFNDITRALA